MANFNQAYEITMKIEGGFANNPNDSGGMTYAGIARNFNPQWPGWRAVDLARKQTGVASQINAILARDSELQADVKRFYKTNYWDINRLDSVLNQAIGEKLFDVGVNMGVGRASRMLQEALNLTNLNGKAYPDIAIDGIIGPQTITLTNAHYRPTLLLDVLQALQGERYLNIMRNNPTQEEFAPSWFSRI